MTAATAVSIPAGEVHLDADVGVPAGARGVVVFAHGSGSSRHSPRNRQVASHLHDQHYATVLADLLTRAEEEQDQQSGRFRFNVDLLAARVMAAVEWVVTAEITRQQPVGLFGASTGAAAALVAAAAKPELVRAVVSRGGRPDLAGESLRQVRAPTLLIVGERDRQVRMLNEEAATRLAGPYAITVVPGATHLFEEPGALPQVAEHAADWFATYLLRRER